LSACRGCRAASIEVVALEPSADDVAVGHHPDHSVVLPNRNAADVMPLHQFRELGDRRVGLTQSTLLCITSLTFPEGVKTEASDQVVTANYVERHIKIGIEALRLVRRRSRSVKHLRFEDDFVARHET
jgi:hypothetical protein